MSKTIRSFCCIHSSNAPFRLSVHVDRTPVMTHSNSRSNNLGRPAIRADFFCPISFRNSFFWPTVRSFPISIGMEADLPSLDQLRNSAAECIRLAIRKR
jgi:hypothetical protein